MYAFPIFIVIISLNCFLTGYSDASCINTNYFVCNTFLSCIEAKWHISLKLHYLVVYGITFVYEIFTKYIYKNLGSIPIPHW